MKKAYEWIINPFYNQANLLKYEGNVISLIYRSNINIATCDINSSLQFSEMISAAMPLSIKHMHFSLESNVICNQAYMCSKCFSMRLGLFSGST